MSNSHPSGSARPVVITGVGIFSPIGIGADAYWASLAAGRSGISRMQLVPYCAAPRCYGGEVAEFNETTIKKQYLKEKEQRKRLGVMCREIQMGVASAWQAMEHAGLNLGEINHERIGVDFGANLMLSPPDVLHDPAQRCVNGDSTEFLFDRWGTGGQNAGGDSGMGAMEPLWLLRYLPNMPACHISIFADARGPSNSITLEEASGNLTMGEATRIISRGHADMMIAGTTGTRLHVVKAMHAALWDRLADSDDPPATWSRPFDKNRMGQVLAEGAATFLLEAEPVARERGARILGRILGAGSSCVVKRDGEPDCRRALANAMRAALSDAGLEPSDVGHINAHGLSTEEADADEAAAILEVFGEAGRQVPVTAIKSYFGNAGSGCGTLELAASVLGLQQGLIPPTLNYTTPDPDCPLNIVRGEPQPAPNKIVLKVNFTRMGQASALLVEAA